MAIPRENPRRMSTSFYGHKVAQYNSLMRSELCYPGFANHGHLNAESFRNPDLWFWRHDRLERRPKLKADGVHLSAESSKRLYYSIRMCLVEVLKTL